MKTCIWHFPNQPDIISDIRDDNLYLGLIVHWSERNPNRLFIGIRYHFELSFKIAEYNDSEIWLEQVNLG